MKLTYIERKAIEMLRQLDEQQRSQLLEYMGRQLIANSVTTRVGSLRRLKTAPDRNIEKAYGAAPWWRSKKHRS